MWNGSSFHRSVLVYGTGSLLFESDCEEWTLQLTRSRQTTVQLPFFSLAFMKELALRWTRDGFKHPGKPGILPFWMVVSFLLLFLIPSALLTLMSCSHRLVVSALMPSFSSASAILNCLFRILIFLSRSISFSLLFVWFSQLTLFYLFVSTPKGYLKKL